MRIVALGLAVMFGGCTLDDPDRGVVELARIDGPGGYVRWIAPAVEGDEPEVEIVATFPDRPLLDPALVAEHGAIAAYLAVAPGEPLPERLREHARDDVDEIDAAALSAINRAMLERAFADVSDDGPVVYDATACDDAFKVWVRSAYGVGYGDNKNCSSNEAFTEQTWGTYYCTPGDDNDCVYPIGGLDECSPAAAEWCSAFSGSLQVARARHHLYSDAYYTYNVYGHRYRFAAANCNGTGDMWMWRKRGGSAWEKTVVPPRSMDIRVGGRDHLPAAARVRTEVTEGRWKEVVPLGGDSYQLNQLVIDPQPGSPGGYACADVQRRFETYDVTWGLCNTHDFCDDNTCDNCWD